MDILSFMQSQIGLFLLVFARISGIFTSAPIFGSRNIPIYTKAGLSLTISIILLPLLAQSASLTIDAFLPYVFIVAGEFLLGVVLGYVCSLFFAAVQMAGQLLDMQIGFGIVNTIDPLFGNQVPLIGNFKYIIALLVFLTTNGHHLLLSALCASFKTIPVTGIVFRSNLTEFVLNIFSNIFIIAFKISLPVLAAILLTEVALGIMSRTMPQMNIFIVGIPGKILIGIFVLGLALPFYIIFLEVVFNGMYSDIYRLLSIFT